MTAATLFAQRQSYRRDLVRQQDAIRQRGLAIGYAHARRIIAAIGPENRTAAVDDLIATLQAAMADEQPIFTLMSKLFVEIPWLFRLFMEATP